ncbi:MCM2/3/5 family-domain-containing protein, partial [Baffinella frigidus]
VKPGDRVQIVGVYKPLTGTGEGGTSGMFRTVVIGVAVRSLAKELLQTAMTTTDIDNIKAMAKRKDVFEAIARSLAPSICGHEWVKRGLLLQLLGGQEKNLHNGTHIRGDINLLM